MLGLGINIVKYQAPSGGLLLDLFPGAIAAYSYRALSSDWENQPVVRVRRNSDNAEADFRADQIGSRTGDLIDFVGTNTGQVVTWYDQSGNGNDMFQIVAAFQPRLVNFIGEIGTYAYGISQGRAAYWDMSYSLESTMVLNNQPLHVFTVGSPYIFSGEYRITYFGLGDLVAYKQYSVEHWNSGPRVWVGDGASYSSVSDFTRPAQYYPNDATIIDTLYSGGILSLYSNGQFGAQSSPLSWSSSETAKIHKRATGKPNRYFLAETIVYNSDYSTKRVQIANNLNKHYDIY